MRKRKRPHCEVEASLPPASRRRVWDFDVAALIKLLRRIENYACHAERSSEGAKRLHCGVEASLASSKLPGMSGFDLAVTIRIRARIHACRKRRVISAPLGAALRGWSFTTG